MHSAISIEQGVAYLQQGKVIAYPTEAVFGLGCDPANASALQQILDLKQRPWHKGLILIASAVEQLLPFLDLTSIPTTRWETILASWPGPYTWVFPASAEVLPLVKGQFASIAVRVTAHPIASALCHQFGRPIISTSANLAEQAPCKTTIEVFQQFDRKIVGVVAGEVGTALQPTTIQDALTGKIYR